MVHSYCHHDPKAVGLPWADMLRPIALQSVLQKWITNLILIQLEDILQQVVSRQQKGFSKHRSILDHIFSSRALWDHMETGAGLSIDFSNAYPTMSHELTRQC